MNIRRAEKSDVVILSAYDKHIRKGELETIISLGRVIVAEENGTFCLIIIGTVGMGKKCFPIGKTMKENIVYSHLQNGLQSSQYNKSESRC